MYGSKLLSIKKDKTIILYNVFIDREQLAYYLNYLDDRYTRVTEEVVEATFDGVVPLSYGKFDGMSEVCSFKDLGVLESRKVKESDDYFKSLGAYSKEWDFLSLEEKKEFMPVEGTRKGRVKLEVTYPSIFVKKFKETFLNDKELIIDCTELIKLYNQMNGLNNNFNFDKTIDLKEKKKKWNDPSNAFLSTDDYMNYLKNANKYLNNSKIEITDEELNRIKEEFNTINHNLRNFIIVEQIGMFPDDIELSTDLEVLKRFAIRNENYKWMESILEYSPINIDGGAVLGLCRNEIINEYDLDGVKKEKEIIKKIDNQVDFFADIDKDEKSIKKELLIKSIKAA